MTDKTVMVPHRPRWSFDVVHCTCGWVVACDNALMARVIVEQHRSENPQPIQMYEWRSDTEEGS